MRLALYKVFFTVEGHIPHYIIINVSIQMIVRDSFQYNFHFYMV